MQNYHSLSSSSVEEEKGYTTNWRRRQVTERQRTKLSSCREGSTLNIGWKFSLVMFCACLAKQLRFAQFVEARYHHRAIAFQTPRRPFNTNDRRQTRKICKHLSGSNLERTTVFGKSMSLQRVSTIATTRCLSTASDSSSTFTDPSSKVLLEGLNEAQVEAVTKPLSSITRVIAGPGAGKTRVLTCRIAHLLRNDPDKRVLAVTFTKKAAGEMQERLKKLVERQEKILEEQNEAVLVTPDVTAPALDVYDDNTIIQEEVNESSGQTKGGRYMDRVTLGTFHSICAKVLRWNGRALASLPSVQKAMSSSPNATSLDGTFGIIDQGEQLRVLKECLTEMGVDLKELGLKPLTILNALGQIKSADIMGQDEAEKSGRKIGRLTKKVATEIYPLYRHKLLSNNALDFDDLIFMARELLMFNEDIRERLQKRWNHVLVDEFQDTSKAQLDLVKLLSSSSLLIVGDADQSIYSWRGAHVESMSDFENEFRHHYLGGVETVYLMENYRSTTNIVKAAQKIISDSTSSSSGNPQNELRKDMKPMRGSGPTPRILACADGKAEASFVVKSILERIDMGEWNEDASVAIIYRTNAQSRALEEACVQLNLPYVIRGSAGTFYNRHEIKDCLCFLRWLYNGRDQAAILRALKTPSRGIGEKAVEEFLRYCSEVEKVYESQYPDAARPTPLDVLISFTDRSVIPEKDIPSPTEFMTKRALNRFVPFSDQMRYIREKAYIQPVSVLLATIIANLDLKSHFDSISKTDSEFEDRWSNVMELRKAADRYSQDGPCLIRHDAYASEQDGIGLAESPLSIFLDDVALVTDTQAGDTDKGAGRLVANLMTIHASKGMEFDAVFLVGNEDGTFPTNQAITEGEGSVPLDEEKRLCYVAMTRAKTHLVMTWRREVQIFAGQGFQKIDAERSRFLDVLISKKRDKKEGAREKTKDRSRVRRSNKIIPPRHKRGAGPNSSRVEKHGLVSRDSARAKKPAAATGPDTHIPGKRLKPKLAPTRPRQPRASDSRSALSDRVVPDGKTRRLSTTAARRERPTVSGMNGQPRTLKNKSNLGDRAKASENVRRLSTAPARKEISSIADNKGRMDSTWFFPVGSKVVHRRHGEGLVLPPPPPDDAGIMLVRVKFPGGEKRDFPADGPDLQPDF